MHILQFLHACVGLGCVEHDPVMIEAAQLFKVLGHESRLALLRELFEAPRTVSSLCEATQLSQPLVSQHLRTLREAHLVTATRRGKQMHYALTDHHVAHLVSDALDHVHEAVTQLSAVTPIRKGAP